MGGWTPISPWKIVPGSGQTNTVAGVGAQSFTNAVGANTQAIAIRLLPLISSSAPYVAMVRIGGTATAALDYPISSNDPPQILGIGEGQAVSVYFPGAGTAYMCELTH
jgi:hypothetical protein